MKYFLCIVVFLFAGLVVPSFTQRCSLIRSSWDEAKDSGSSNFRLGEMLSLGEMAGAKVFHDDESGLDVAVGYATVRSLSKRVRPLLRLSLVFSSKPEDAFDSHDRSEAETVLDSKMRMLTVARDARVG